MAGVKYDWWLCVSLGLGLRSGSAAWDGGDRVRATINPDGGGSKNGFLFSFSPRLRGGPCLAVKDVTTLGLPRQYSKL